MSISTGTVSPTGSAVMVRRSVLNLYHPQQDMAQARMLSDRWRVFQISPLGYGFSDRVHGYAGEALPDQLVSVLDRHDANRFVVWGYSAAAAMAACVARAAPSVAGMVCGGFSPEPLLPGVMRRLDRRLDPDHPSRGLWWWFNEFDWTAELSAMSEGSRVSPMVGILNIRRENRDHRVSRRIIGLPSGARPAARARDRATSGY